MSYELISYPDYLAHYGIKGQKWGVRRFQNEDGSLTPAGKEHYGLSNGGSGNEKLAGRYAREVKKLKKLSDKADVDLQRSRAEKYDSRAKKAGKAAAGLAAATLAEATASHLIRKNFPGAINKAYGQAGNYRIMANHKTDVPYLNRPTDLRNQLKWENRAHNLENLYFTDQKVGMPAYKVLAGATAVATGAAAYNKIQAVAAKRRTTDIGHAKAVQKRQKQIDRMTKMFADTPYSELIGK